MYYLKKIKTCQETTFNILQVPMIVFNRLDVAFVK